MYANCKHNCLCLYDFSRHRSPPGLPLTFTPPYSFTLGIFLGRCLSTSNIVLL
ncbi:hypothetical protein CPK_ORF00568 [Chlamydia pneumoniae LPCoLN]|uniref:Uncharacterized protein n=1 Tax=Chlamydia pneumoniae TaxID=83558 RepID=Q9Z9B8_CHLPN|nr:hypothetical protein CPn_0063 [Chlamydia pneumoniae CWL029]AAF38519.1 hypothetical protein CP_0711 [Chlamydia pneumoniae AR39]ACZ33038.1 hypothetical protein CPK_ORF00568 [Chlamydia pneumoniae LPCoLN]ETR79935.1 hypothetical protein X556_0736 [Chlamydia pneumoniae B21]CRI32560.1 Uncharacterized protein BN1224_Wien1_A_00670 [Chlamydia pneumoniae]BAA98274.1 hypothetical protein [Chlamydia pneumoniae J138]